MICLIKSFGFVFYMNGVLGFSVAHLAVEFERDPRVLFLRLDEEKAKYHEQSVRWLYRRDHCSVSLRKPGDAEKSPLRNGR